MRDTMVEGSGLILTTWDFLTFAQITVHKHFCIPLQSQCGRRYRESNL